ncbi:MAG: hypothetical protein EP297_12095 [Gammaproteobacteria bacterium]|nr:MAG: hypothetical protein EP297_12095 [Gammaproteobacteria bacterium]
MKSLAITIAAVSLMVAMDANAVQTTYGLTLDAKATSYRQDPDSYELPGFGLGGEAGLDDEGFSLNHSEVSMQVDTEHATIKFTTAIEEDDADIDAELEELYIESVGLGNGFTARAGRFFTSVGYQNQQHAHAWDFADAPLVYRGFWGKQYIDDGLRLSWIAPTDLFIELGLDALDGGEYPSGSHSWDGIDAYVAFANFGGDIDESHSWQAGATYYSADVDDRLSGGHDHGGDEEEETPSFSGDSDVLGLNFVYKWAPNGNYRNRNFKFQSELFIRDDNGDVVMKGSDPLETTTYRGKQKGIYLQGIYQFKPQWRTGMRFDYLTSDNKGSDAEVLEEAGLDDEGINPKRWSVMLDYAPSEMRRWRLQFNRDKSYERNDNQILLQYVISFGAHGAHTF